MSDLYFIFPMSIFLSLQIIVGKFIFLAYLINATGATDSPPSDVPERSLSSCLSWAALMTSYLACEIDRNH